MKPILKFLTEYTLIVLIALAIVLPVRYFLFQPFLVKGQSMEPSFENGDYLIVDEISYRLSEPQRGEVVVFEYPNDPSQRFIKRIIGLPGETIEVQGGQVVVFNNSGERILSETAYLPVGVFTPGETEITLASDEYFVLGDNRSVSLDSRGWGPLNRDFIVGKVFLRLLPFS